MLQQIYIDSQFSDIVLGDGSHVFWLSDAVYVPDRHTLQVKVLNAWIPHTFYSIFEANDTIVLGYYPPEEPMGTAETIAIPHGNRSIDEILDIINPRLQYGYEASYDVATNRISFESALNTGLDVEAGTTCGELLGVSVGDRASAGAGGAGRVLRAGRGVDLTRTSSIFIRSNLHTANRDPVTRRTSDILAKIPLTSQYNELEHFTSQAWVDCNDKQVSYVVVKLVNDHGRLMDLNGARFTLTIKLNIEQNDEPVEDSIRALESERAAAARSGQLRAPGAAPSGGERAGGGGGGTDGIEHGRRVPQQLRLGGPSEAR